MVSESIMKVTGFWVEPEPGSIVPAVQKFVESQPEPLDISRLVIEEFRDGKLLCRISTKVADHESRSPFRLDVRFTLDPLTGAVVRSLD